MARPTRRLDLVSFTAMEEAGSTEQNLVALRAALLAYYDEHTFALGRQPLLTKSERLMSQALERLRLKWLAIGALLVVGAARSKRQGRPMVGDVRPVARQYGQLAVRILMWRGPRCCGLSSSCCRWTLVRGGPASGPGR
jgi:hypothetical protein